MLKVGDCGVHAFEHGKETHLNHMPLLVMPSKEDHRHGSHGFGKETEGPVSQGKKMTYKYKLKECIPKVDIKNKRNDYKFVKKHGRFNFGNIILATNEREKEDVSIKIILKANIASHLEILDREIGILKSIRHPNIIQFKEVFQTDLNYYIIFKHFLTYESLLLKLTQNYRFGEIEVYKIVTQLLSALEHLHERGIAHRDVKPDNILINDQAEVILTGFTFSKRLDVRTKTMSGVAGTFGFISPEIFENAKFGMLYGAAEKGYTTKCDIWSLGITIYTIVNLKLPLKSKNPRDLLHEVKGNRFVSIKDAIWSEFSYALKDFMLNCLDVDFTRRPSVQQLWRHPWVKIHKRKQEKLGKLGRFVGRIGIK